MEAITNTFVLVAPDCPVTAAVVPVARGANPTIPVIQYELLTTRPYRLTLENLIFETHVRRVGLSRGEARDRAAEIRAELFARPQACMRASVLPKKYGWGVHYDGQGRIALYAMESEEYRRFAVGAVAGVKVVAALRSQRAR
jgi:Family of unknown function (DUF6157)